MLDFVAFAVNPQVHAFDNASLVETLEGQAAAVASARRLAGDVPVAVSPVTLKPRRNPYATGPEPAAAAGELPPQVDVRQMSLFGAGWTAGSLKRLSEAGAGRITYYETTGWRGVMETESGSPLPGKFRSLPGGVFPLYHVLADAAEFAGGEVVASRSSDPLRVDGVALRRGSEVRVIAANFSDQPARVTLRRLGPRARVRMLDETTAIEAMAAPEAFRARVVEEVSTSCGDLDIVLRPYAVARIDAMT